MILFAVVLFCFGQDSPTAKLTDEFGSINCEDVLARVDNFMIEITDAPASVGYAVIYPDKVMRKEAFEQESWIIGNIIFRDFPKDRLLVVRGEEKDELQVQFWLVPAGTEKPKFNDDKWSYFVKGSSKPFVFFDTYPNEACLSTRSQTYVDFLADNPGTRGHIVIFNKPRHKARKEAEKWLKIFTKDGRVSRDRFKVFFAKNTGIADAEFWVVPPRKSLPPVKTGRNN